MDHGNACIHRLQWTLKLHFLAVEDNLARGARLNADQTLHQCRFTCTVFTHQSMNGTGAKVKRYAFKSSYARKFLDNVVHFEDILTHVCVHPAFPTFLLK